MPEGKTPNAEVGEMNESSIEGECPFRAPYPTESARTNESWWPRRLNLKILAKNPVVSDLLTTSQDWWPADYGTTAACSSG
jgi:catalase-peroxidase